MQFDGMTFAGLQHQRLFSPLASVMKVVLRRIFDGFEFDDVVVCRSHFLIGSGNSCQLRPHGFFVAKRHCVIELRQESAAVRHLAASRYSTLVNGRRVLGVRALTSGDVLSVGFAAYRILIIESMPSESRVKVMTFGTQLPLHCIARQLS